MKKKKKEKKRETETHSGKTKVLNINPAVSGTTTTGQKPRKVPTSHNGMLIYPQRGYFLPVCVHVSAWMYSHHEYCVCLCKCIANCACGTCPRDFLSVGHSHSSLAMVTQLIWRSPSWFLTAAILTRLLSEQPWPA